MNDKDEKLKKIEAGMKYRSLEEQYGLRQSRGCMDQVLAVRQVCENNIANGKDIFWEFVMEKSYGTIDRHGWQMQECID